MKIDFIACVLRNAFISWTYPNDLDVGNVNLVNVHVLELELNNILFICLNTTNAQKVACSDLGLSHYRYTQR